jgi:hypothetical protein
MIDALSLDGYACKQLESSYAVPTTGWHVFADALPYVLRTDSLRHILIFSDELGVTPSARYAIVPEENVSSCFAEEYGSL